MIRVRDNEFQAKATEDNGATVLDMKVPADSVTGVASRVAAGRTAVAVSSASADETAQSSHQGGGRFPPDIIVSAKAIFAEFIRHAIGTIRPKRDRDGNLIRDRFNRIVPETLEEAVERRWTAMPELQRHRFCTEAEAALGARRAA